MPKPLILAVVVLLGAGAPAAALDCNKAKTPVDKAICTDPKAVAADTAMTAAYQALFYSLSEPKRKQLVLSQRRWLKERTYGCSDATAAQLAQCVTRRSVERQRFLEGRPEAGPGSGGPLRPVVIEQAGRTGYYEIDVTVLKYAPPISAGEKLFNSEVDKLLKQVPGAGENDSFGRDMVYSFILHMRMVYASPKLISARLDTYQFSGGAHGNGGISDINIDVPKAKILQFADVFPATAKQPLEAECLRQILKQKAKRAPDETIEGDTLTQLKQAVDDGLGKFDSWSFSPAGATVDYDAYALGAYVEGSYGCDFSAAFLRPLVKPSFALP